MSSKLQSHGKGVPCWGSRKRKGPVVGRDRCTMTVENSMRDGQICGKSKVIQGFGQDFILRPIRSYSNVYSEMT